MKRGQIESQISRYRYFVTIFCILLLSACQGDHSSSGHTGALAVNLHYQGDNIGSADSPTETATFDCAQKNVTTIKATVYDDNNNEIATPEPFDCASGRGTIEAVPAGKGRTVVILGKDKKGRVLIRGERSNITVVANKINKTKPIPYYSFVPVLETPENGALAKADATLKWKSVDNAAKYRVTVWPENAPENRNIDIVEGGEKTEFTLQAEGLTLQTYNWQVEAIDAQGNESTASQTWSISTIFLSSIATGDDHTMAIRPDHTLWSWGRNCCGQLGLGDSGEDTARSKPAKVDQENDWAHVNAGHHHSVALKTNGTLLSWGNNETYELGLGDNNYRDKPTEVGQDRDWAYVSVGDGHTVALKRNGQLWAWGSNKHGQLGRGDDIKLNPSQSKPTYTAEKGGPWAFVAAGAHHTLAINQKGELWAWGNNADHQLGTGDNTSVDQIVPVPVDSDRSWTHVATSSSHSVAVKKSGELWSWGANNFGQLGHEGDQTHYAKPKQVGGDSDWAYAITAEFYTLAVKKNGELWAWGRNGYGQLGLGDRDYGPTARKVDIANCIFAATRSNHTAVVDEKGQIWCWGRNTFGELGNEIMGRKSLPTRIDGDTSWKFIAAGNSNSYTLAGDSDGLLWAWGRNEYSQVGIGDIYQLQTPTKLEHDGPWVSAAAGQTYAAAIKADDENGRTLWTWGHGYLGNGAKEDIQIPTKVGNRQGWDSVACGDSYTLAILVTGTDPDPQRTLWAWGYNNYGQLGLGENEIEKTHSTPTQIVSDISWKTVSAGGNFVVAIKADHTLWAWGYNNYGQVAQSPEQAQLPTPTQVGNADNWASVTTGNLHTLAIKTDHTLWAWGANGFGQIGNGTTNASGVHTPTPVRPEDNTGWRSAAAGNNCSVAIRNDNTLWGWGHNDAGQLGGTNLGAKVEKPTQIGTDEDWKDVAIGLDHTIAIKEDGTIYCWGGNINGQLGDGDAWELSPVQVIFE